MLVSYIPSSLGTILERLQIFTTDEWYSFGSDRCDLVLSVRGSVSQSGPTMYMYTVFQKTCDHIFDDNLN